MEYVVGPVIALLFAMKFADWKVSTHCKNHCTETNELIAAQNTRIELVEQRNSEVDQEMLQKVMTTVTPIAKAVVKLNQEVGLQ